MNSTSVYTDVASVELIFKSDSSWHKVTKVVPTSTHSAQAADVRRKEVEHAVHAVVGDVLAIEAALVLEVLLVRAVDVLLDGAPAGIMKIITFKTKFRESETIY